MTRRFLDNVRADYLAQEALGTPIEKAVMIPIHIDHLDSTIQDECAIASTAPLLALATVTTFTPLTTVYDVESGGDGVFLKPDFASGEIVTNTTPGFTYVVYANLTVVDASNNDPIEAVIMLDGVAIGTPDEKTGQGNNDPVSFSLRTYINSAPVNGVIQVGIRTPVGADVVDVSQCSLALVIQPTNNP